MPPSKTTQDILRCIIPWALESNARQPKYRSNYKGNRGRIGIVGGARDYAGAPYFAAASTMRLGADLGYVICSRGASQVIKSYSPDLIVMPLLDHENELVFNSEMDCLLSRLHALVVGPGLGREELMLKRARILIEKAKTRSIPLVLDADSLLLVQENPNLIKSYNKALLTPNRIELQRLLESLFAPEKFALRDITDVQALEKLVKRCSSYLGVSIIAKGLVDICTDSTGFVLNSNDRLGSNRRCGGQGDILAGMAGVFSYWIDQANSSETSPYKIDNPLVWAGHLASTITRQCNEVAYKEFRNGMLVSDMIPKISSTLDNLMKHPNQNSQIHSSSFKYSGSFSAEQINRYRRQMIMDEFGPERQLKLSKSSVLIIGAGGLGCPASIYLAAAGIGRLGIVDDDTVEVSNLHRQILHSVNKIGMLKTESIKQSILDINPDVVVETHSVRLTRHNAVDLIEKYDVIIDATDNITSRYMINDASVLSKKPLVSGAALKMDGQLTVYNYNNQTPCFRCLFPVPPEAGATGSCSANGVLGMLPGVIGIQQAMEALKICSGLKPAYAGKMLLFDGQLGLFRHITLGPKKSDCVVCGLKPQMSCSLIDYEEFCNPGQCQSSSGSSSNILQDDERITVQQYKTLIDKPHVLVDVRPLVQSKLSSFQHALRIPVMDLINKQEESIEEIRNSLKSQDTNIIYVVCRRGIASQRGTRIIQELLHDNNIIVKDIIGGMSAWSAEVDTSYSCL